MKSVIIIFSIYVLLNPYQLIAQSFVANSNLWSIKDCQNGNCENYNYWFEDSLTINSQIYSQLNTDNPSLLEAFGIPFYGKYYRQENGKVYLKYDEYSDETLIYDFDLIQGETTVIPLAGEFSVIMIDSLTLESGTRRKRLLIQNIDIPNQRMYWVEGIGSTRGTMNTQLMAIQDTWTELSCFAHENNLEYQLDGCLISSVNNVKQNLVQINCYPNPATNYIIIESSIEEAIKTIEIVSATGNIIHYAANSGFSRIELKDVQNGVYFLKAIHKNGSCGFTKIIKSD